MFILVIKSSEYLKTIRIFVEMTIDAVKHEFFNNFFLKAAALGIISGCAVRRDPITRSADCTDNGMRSYRRVPMG